MVIVEDDKFKGLYKAQVREGEVIHFRGQLDWDDKNAGLTLEYLFQGEKILNRRIEQKWWWRFIGGGLDHELKTFMYDGMKRATEIRAAQKKSKEMAEVAKVLFKDE